MVLVLTNKLLKNAAVLSLLLLELKNGLLDYSYDDENSFDGHP